MTIIPRALQYCSIEEPSKDVLNIDICKCYPCVLINNVSHCGEFYFDETVLNNYDLPVKLGAGFYSSNLVSYLVDTLKMPISQIKYKITTKLALNPDTFKDFLLYIFKNFPEKEAKAMANSFIGEL